MVVISSRKRRHVVSTPDPKQRLISEFWKPVSHAIHKIHATHSINQNNSTNSTRRITKETTKEIQNQRRGIRKLLTRHVAGKPRRLSTPVSLQLPISPKRPPFPKHVEYSRYIAYTYQVDNRHSANIIRGIDEEMGHPEAVTRLLGIPTIINASPTLPITSVHVKTNNIICEMRFPVSCEFGLIPTLNEKVAVYGQQLRMSFILYTVFGTVSYQPENLSVECSGVRNLSHMDSLAKTIHQFPLVSVYLTRYCVESSIGRYVEVCEGGFIERVLRILYKSDIVYIAGRLDDVTNATHFKINSVADFLNRSKEMGILSNDYLDTATLIVYDWFNSGLGNMDSHSARILMESITEQLSLTVLLTRTGSSTYRFSFMDGFTCGGGTGISLDTVEHAFRSLVVVMNYILQKLC